jgi:hypothetical protein
VNHLFILMQRLPAAASVIDALCVAYVTLDGGTLQHVVDSTCKSSECVLALVHGYMIVVIIDIFLLINVSSSISIIVIGITAAVV